MAVKNMRADAIRHWLGTYVLVLTAVLGTYLILAGGSWLLPLEDNDVTSAFEIVVPFLLTQVVIAYKFFTSQHASAKEVPGLPTFLVKAPMLLVTMMLLVTGTLMAVGGHTGAAWTPSAGQFKALITFCVSILNASAIFVIARYFEASGG